MPRTTRAAARNAVLEDAVDAAEIPLPATPTRAAGRAPLGEISANTPREEPQPILLEVNLEKPAKPKKQNEKKKANQGAKKPRKAAAKKDNKPQPEVVEDDCPSSASSAVAEACRQLSRHGSHESLSGPVVDRRPVTPPSKAVRRAVKQLSPKHQTPRFDPELHKAPTTEGAREAPKEDSFVAAIETRTPGKVTMEPFPAFDPAATFQEPVASPSSDAVTKHLVRSPRIEDSVEEIDKLEEAIDKFGAELPVAIDEPAPPAAPIEPTKEIATELKEPKKTTTAKEGNKNGPTKATSVTKTKAPSTVKPGTAKSATARAASKPVQPAKSNTVRGVTKPTAATSTSKGATVAAKPSVSRPSIAPKAKAASPTAVKSRPSAVKPAATPEVAPTPVGTKPAGTRSATTPGPAARPHARVVSITKPPFVPTKSAKPPTTSTFKLPGEAISERLKAQREERLKREAEAAKAQREFKARPVRRSSGAAPPPVGSVRSTAATRVRLSMAKPAGPKPTGAPAAANTPAAPTGPPKTARVPAARTASTPARAANIKAPRSPPKTTMGGTTTTRVATKPAAPAAAAITVPRVRAKAPPTKTEFQVRQEREEAARKARAEAAERGRAASRAWAEKMRGPGQPWKRKGPERLTAAALAQVPGAGTEGPTTLYGLKSGASTAVADEDEQVAGPAAAA